MITIKQINKEITKLGYNAELVKGEGYFYFVGDDVLLCFTTSVYVNSVNQLTLEQWIESCEDLVKEQRHHILYTY